MGGSVWRRVYLELCKVREAAASAVLTMGALGNLEYKKVVIWLGWKTSHRVWVAGVKPGVPQGKA